jgi:hypothetical protein
MIKLIRQSKEVETKDGIKRYTNFFIVLENGSYIPIKPAFKNDYKVLYVMSTEKE